MDYKWINEYKAIRITILREINKKGILNNCDKIYRIYKENFDKSARHPSCGNTFIAWVIAMENAYKKYAENTGEKVEDWNTTYTDAERLKQIIDKHKLSVETKPEEKKIEPEEKKSINKGKEFAERMRASREAKKLLNK